MTLQTSTEAPPPQAHPTDCVQCRIVGGTAFSGLGLYALYQSRAAAPGSVFGKRITAVLGLGFLAAGATRFII